MFLALFLQKKALILCFQYVLGFVPSKKKPGVGRCIDLLTSSQRSPFLPAMVLEPVGSRALPLPPLRRSRPVGSPRLTCSSPPTRPNRVLTPAHRGIQPSLSPRLHPPDPDAEARWQLAETKKAKIQYKLGMFIVKKNIYRANIPADSSDFICRAPTARRRAASIASQGLRVEFFPAVMTSGGAGSRYTKWGLFATL